MEPLHSVRFEAMESDLAAVTARSLRASPLTEKTYRRNWRAGIVAWVIVTGSLVTPMYLSAPTPLHGMVRTGIFMVLWLPVFRLYARRNLTRAAFDRKLGELAAQSAKERVKSSPMGPVEVLLFPERVEIIEPEQQLAKPWSAVTAVVESAGATYIDFKDGVVVHIPDRAFRMELDRWEFVETAQRLVGRTT